MISEETCVPAYTKVCVHEVGEMTFREDMAAIECLALVLSVHKGRPLMFMEELFRLHSVIDYNLTSDNPEERYIRFFSS